MKKLFNLAIALGLLLALIPGVAVAAPQGQGEETVYTVQKDDSLWAIAEKYLGNGAAYGAIVVATNAQHETDSSFAKIDDPSLIQPGWKLLIPGAEEVAKFDLKGETITIYHFGDLSGPYAAITAPLIHGAEDAVAAINERGGLYGATFDIKFADTAGSIDEAVAAYDRFTGEGENPLVMITYGSGVYDLSPTADTTTAILNAQAAGANVIWTNTLAFGPAAILNDLNALGLRDQFVVAGDNWAMDLATYAFLADPAYGVGLIAPFPYLWWTDMDNSGVQYAQQLFEANERQMAEHNVGYLLLVASVDLAVDAIKLAIDTVGYENLTGEAVHDAMMALGPHEPLDGVLRVDYSGDSRSPHKSQIRMIQGGPDAFVVIQDWAEMADLRPTE